MGAVTDLGKLITNTADVGVDFFRDEDDPKKAIFSKSQRDKTPMFYYLSDVAPILNTSIDLLNLRDKPID